MGPKNTTCDSQKQPTLRTCRGGGWGVGAVPTVTVFFLRLSLYGPRSDSETRLFSGGLPAACAFQNKVFLLHQREEKQKTAHTDHGPEAGEGNRRNPSALHKRPGEEKNAPAFASPRTDSSAVPDEQ